MAKEKFKQKKGLVLSNEEKSNPPQILKNSNRSISSKRFLKESSARVAIVMGSDSDYPVMKEAAAALDQFNISYTMSIVSAHRTPLEMVKFASEARNQGLRVIIAGAGGAAHLPGMIASITELPVIGVPVPMGHLQGQDSLLSIVQMPKGVPVATVAIGNAWNAGILAAQILGASSSLRSSEEPSILDQIASYKSDLRKQVMQKVLPTSHKK